MDIFNNKLELQNIVLSLAVLFEFDRV